MIGRISFVAVAATLVAATAFAQPSPAGPDTLPLTLDDAVRRAVEHNPDLAIVKLATEVEAAHVGETQTAYTPVFSTTLGRESGRPSVLGFKRCPPRKSSSMNFR